MTFGVSFSSSVFSADTRVTAKKFNVSEEVMVSNPEIYLCRAKIRQCGRTARLQLMYAPYCNRSWAYLYMYLDLLVVCEILEFANITGRADHVRPIIFWPNFRAIRTFATIVDWLLLLLYHEHTGGCCAKSRNNLRLQISLCGVWRIGRCYCSWNSG